MFLVERRPARNSGIGGFDGNSFQEREHHYHGAGETEGRSAWRSVGRISAVGTTAELEKSARRETRIIDLQRQTLLPGFVDTHSHFCLYALLTDQADCRPAAGCRTGEDVVQALRALAKKTKPGKWIMGWGYAPYLLDDQKDLTREDLDRASTKHPICLVHVSVHGCVVNSLGLERTRLHQKNPESPRRNHPPGWKRKPQRDPERVRLHGPPLLPDPLDLSQMLAEYDREEEDDLSLRGQAPPPGIVGAHDPLVDAPTLQRIRKPRTRASSSASTRSS